MNFQSLKNYHLCGLAAIFMIQVARLVQRKLWLILMTLIMKGTDSRRRRLKPLASLFHPALKRRGGKATANLACREIRGLWKISSYHVQHNYKSDKPSDVCSVSQRLRNILSSLSIGIIGLYQIGDHF